MFHLATEAFAVLGRSPNPRTNFPICPERLLSRQAARVGPQCTEVSVRSATLSTTFRSAQCPSARRLFSLGHYRNPSNDLRGLGPYPGCFAGEQTYF